MNKLVTIFLAYLVLYCGSALGAGNDTEVLEDVAIVIIDEEPIPNVPRHTLSRQVIESIAPASTVDLLRSVPGVTVTQQGGNGGLTFVSIRGGEPNFTVVLIDGVKVNDIINSRGGGYDFVGLDPQLIERIEVYYGGLSTIYGSEALGGVISITTLSAREEKKSLSIEAGSDEQHAEAFHLASLIGDNAVANISGAYRDGGGAVQGDSLERKQIIFKLNALPGNEIDWQMSFFHSDGESASFPEDSGGDQFAVIREVEQREFEQNNLAGKISWHVNNNWQVALKADFAKHDEQLDNPGIAAGVLASVPAIFSDSQFTHKGLNLTNIVELSDETKLDIGAEWTRESGGFDSVIDFGFPVTANFEIDRDIHAVFAEINHQVFETLSVTGGVRYDDADGIEETTFRFAAKYSPPSTDANFFFQYGEGFKLPSFFALGHPLVGNSALKPEFSKNTSARVEKSFFDSRLGLAATYFYNQFSNLVDFDPILFTNVNRSKVVAKGGEIELIYSPDNTVHTSVYVTYTDYSVDTGETLRRRPDLTGGVSVLWEPNKTYYVSLQADYVSSFYDSSIPTGLIEMDGYTKVDATIGWHVNSKVNLKFITNNIFNSGFEETVGFSNPGREFRLILKVGL